MSEDIEKAFKKNFYDPVEIIEKYTGVKLRDKDGG